MTYFDNIIRMTSLKLRRSLYSPKFWLRASKQGP